MSLFDMNDLYFSYGDDKLLNGVSMRLFHEEHAVLVGQNGTGKSTLLKLIDKQLTPDAGSITYQGGKTIGYLDQYAAIPGSMMVKDYLQKAFATLFAKENTMETLYEKVAKAKPAQQEKLLNRATEIGEYLLETDFYAIKTKIGKIIGGLGLSIEVLDEPIKHLSGGMRAKIILAKLLLEEADVLLLDEPTNFLDEVHIDWLGKFLNDYPKAFLVVSHHEPFLRQIAQTVLELFSGDIHRYKGNYDLYLNERQLRYKQQKKAFATQQQFITRTEEFIQKNITRAKTSGRAKSRRKMLAKLPRVHAPRKRRRYRFAFPIGRETGQEVLKINDLEIGYSIALVEPLSLEVRKQEKVAITGKNGIGKTTLIKTLIDELKPLGGNYRWIDTANIAYFSQESTLPKDQSPFMIVANAYPMFTRLDIMNLLGSHGIDREKSQRALHTLSGGETTKVRLALLRHKKSNILILDEPTNHLDQEAQDALKEALIAYQGTMIIVTHDQSFYDGLCDYEIKLYEN